MAVANFEPPPIAAWIASQFKATAAWIRWFFLLSQEFTAALVTVDALSLIEQHAALPSTSIGDASVPGGIYRISWSTRVTTPGGSTSQLQVTVQVTQDGVVVEFAGPSLTSNAITTAATGSVQTRVDPNTFPRILTSYASTGVPVMKYSLDATVVAVANPTRRTS